MDRPDRQLIRQRFSRSLDTYAENAGVQRKTARRLIMELQAAERTSFGRILEIGCGCGLLTEMIAGELEFDELILNDIVEQCEALTKKIKRCTFIGGDVEKIELPCNLDMVISNATFHWLADLPAMLSKIAGAMNPGGLLAFSTFGPDNLKEVAQTTGVALKYFTAADVKQQVAKQFDMICFNETHSHLNFETPIDVLKHLKSTGVTGIAKKHWTKSAMAKFCDDYAAKFSTPTGVTLTYHPIVIIAEKK